METLTLLFVGTAGLIFGSFFNVVIYRLPHGLNLSRPPSACPGCGARIKPYDNVPVLSYLILRGRCRKCGQRISLVYPLVEALTALGFVLVYLNAGRQLSLAFFAGCLFTSALIVLGFIDYLDGNIYYIIAVPGLILALVDSFFRNDLTFPLALIGAAFGAGFLLLFYSIWRYVLKREGLGLGDVILMLMVGAFLGWQRTFLTLLLASLVGSFIGIFLILRRGKNFQSSLPFGVFIAPAAFAAMLWGEWILRRLGWSSLL
jgi:leader peptidase (prepilin peptidase)/N-methyltransferase